MSKKRFPEPDPEAVRRQYAEESLRVIHDSDVVDKLAELANVVKDVKKKRPKKK